MQIMARRCLAHDVHSARIVVLPGSAPSTAPESSRGLGMTAHNTVAVPMPASAHADLNRRIPWFGVDDAERWIA